MMMSKMSDPVRRKAIRRAWTDAPTNGSEQSHRLREDAASVDAGISLLTEVDFKWLMAGQGWWIDTTRFHRDAAYAARFLHSALDSQSFALRECAAALLAQVHGRAPCEVGARAPDEFLNRP